MTQDQGWILDWNTLDLQVRDDTVVGGDMLTWGADGTASGLHGNGMTFGH